MDSQAWTERLHQEIPITKAIGINVAELSAQNIKVSAPLANNINVHQTAFAGSIYTVGIVAGWTLLSSYLRAININATVVASKADIQYKRPIAGDIVATCEFAEKAPETIWLPLFTQKKPARHPLSIQFYNNETLLAHLHATFYIKPQ
ncbi:YiiD C-terminal domain-containing protein [Pleionea sp. CnH1-48]|uniref:YiiD C-terminal domain-containing protein n=1 Tax=Pleionea sp. CnH1-48 TaxID=2954494 RepID=UPI002096A889|nr:YiiD C-terminal domain-containing protein [Pleionea sp. CnH1-48]MCO7224644.1 thioesterase domain-containing protein [Pleionea sp. CnH1-48]